MLIPLVSLALMAQTPVPRPPVPGALAAGFAEPRDSDPIGFLGPRTIRYADFLGWLKLVAGPGAAQIRGDPSRRSGAMRQFLDLQVLDAKAEQEHIQDTPDCQRLLAALEQQGRAKLLLDEDRPGGDGRRLRNQAEHPSEAELLAFFQAHRERFALPERFTARHILVRVKDGLGAQGLGLPEPEAQRKVAWIQQALQAGRNFQDLARAYSEDAGSRAAGGLYQDIPFGRFPLAFEQAVRTQALGQVGEPVQTAFGYHLILVEAREPAAPAEYGQAREAVRAALIPERRERLRQAFLAEARKRVGYRPSAVLARYAWEEKRARSLAEAQAASGPGPEAFHPRWLGLPRPGPNPP
jgi:hypothetical protein